MPHLDLVFPALGVRLRTDHAYPLYAALCHLVPWLHTPAASGIAVCSIVGRYCGSGQLALNPHGSRLRVRVPADCIPNILPLAGKRIRVMGDWVQFGAPEVRALTPSTALYAHFVTIKHAETEEGFLEAVRVQLDQQGIVATIEVPRFAHGEREGEPRRRVMRIKDTCVVGFPVRLTGLTPEDSVKVQEVGVGGRRRMGAGVFLPVSEEEQP